MTAEVEYQFGPYRLLIERRLLLDGDKPVRIGGRALDLLVLLVQQAGSVVTKDALMAHAWPGCFVEETSLRFHITTLRRILGEGQGGARYIANISGRGYCLVAETRRSGAAAGISTAPPPPAISQTPHNLPARLTRLLGRDALLDQLLQQSRTERLLTLLGPGGMGKSALALALAEKSLGAFPGGVWYVDLSMVQDASLIGSTLATAAGIGVDPKSALAHLLTSLQDRKVLFVLDNCEHLVLDTSLIASALLGGLRQLHIVATSREALQLRGEVLVPVGALDTPPPDAPTTAAAVERFPSVQLFVERAIASVGSFALSDEDAAPAAEIVRQLDGMPLAIELVAARVDSFGVSGLLCQLDDRFPLLTQRRRGGPERHRTLRSLLDWSFQHLSQTEQAVLRRAAIFGGAFDEASLCAVACDVEVDRAAVARGLSGLVARSLVSVEATEPEPRYRLLTTTRLYALDHLRNAADHQDVRVPGHTRRPGLVL